MGCGIVGDSFGIGVLTIETVDRIILTDRQTDRQTDCTRILK